MKRNLYPWPMLCLTLVVLLTLSAPSRAAQADEAGIRDAVTTFYSALNAMFTGDPEPMYAAWSHSDSVTYMGPDGGYEIGWPKVQASWEKQAAKKLGGKVEPTDIHIIAGSQLAVVDNYEKGVNTNAAGKQQNVLLRATNVFRNEGGTWKMVGHHTDTLPYLKN